MPLYNSKNTSNIKKSKNSNITFPRTEKELKQDGDTHLETRVRNYFFD
jgi:hypothetical protein